MEEKLVNVISNDIDRRWRITESRQGNNVATAFVTPTEIDGTFKLSYSPTKCQHHITDYIIGKLEGVDAEIHSFPVEGADKPGISPYLLVVYAPGTAIHMLKLAQKWLNTDVILGIYRTTEFRYYPRPVRLFQDNNNSEIAECNNGFIIHFNPKYITVAPLINFLLWIIRLDHSNVTEQFTTFYPMFSSLVPEGCNDEALHKFIVKHMKARKLRTVLRELINNADDITAPYFISAEHVTDFVNIMGSEYRQRDELFYATHSISSIGGLISKIYPEEATLNVFRYSNLITPMLMTSIIPTIRRKLNYEPNRAIQNNILKQVFRFGGQRDL